MPQRYIAAFMAFLSLVSVQIMTGSLSLTITQMVKNTIMADTEQPDIWLEQACPAPKTNHLNGSANGAEVSEPFRAFARECAMGF